MFSPTTDDRNKPVIEISTDQLDLNGINSIQYWYLDDGGEIEGQENIDSYDKNDYYFHFVFGINRNEDGTFPTHIYLSLLNKRDQTVYDFNNNPIGASHNYAENDEYRYGYGQYFDFTNN